MVKSVDLQTRNFRIVRSATQFPHLPIHHHHHTQPLSTMPREYHPLLNTSPEPPSPTPSHSHLNYTYSLHAALLAFPLPSPHPAPTTTTPLTRRHSTFSPLQRYNANHDHLTQARQTRLRARQSLLLPSTPVYALRSEEHTSELQ